MASLLLKGVHKRLGLSSISCSSADATSVVTGTTSRTIDRHSPHLRDPHRSSTSKPPKLNTASSNKDYPSIPNSNSSSKQHHGSKKKKKSTTAATTTTTTTSSRSSEKRFVSPATSSRFLLNSSRLQSDDVIVDQQLALPPPLPSSFIDILPAGDVPLAESGVQVAESSGSSSSSEITAAPVGGSSSSACIEHDGKKAVIMRSCSTATRTQGQVQVQVVVLRVSLHCKGCAGKVKKHISKMEGVTSFDIDIATKKVTVVGDVTPLGVLNSVSKVKAAQFWPSPPRASASF